MILIDVRETQSAFSLKTELSTFHQVRKKASIGIVGNEFIQKICRCLENCKERACVDELIKSR